VIQLAAQSNRLQILIHIH